MQLTGNLFAPTTPQPGRPRRALALLVASIAASAACGGGRSPKAPKRDFLSPLLAKLRGKTS